MRAPSLCHLLAAAILALPIVAAADEGAPKSPLFEMIDKLDVEHHWPAGQVVDWRTGMPTGKPVRDAGEHTHCSQFVAAAAEHAGIYILRPPEHSPVLLANAQQDWLGSDAGKAAGWRGVDSAAAAQDLANRGWFVVASYKSHRVDRAGHIAILRPSAKSAGELGADGPQITQAGERNYRSTSVRIGFAQHPHAFSGGEVRYYAHRYAAND